MLAAALGLVALMSHLKLEESFVGSKRKPQPPSLAFFTAGASSGGHPAAIFGIATAASGSFVTPFAKAEQLDFCCTLLHCLSLRQS